MTIWCWIGIGLIAFIIVVVLLYFGPEWNEDNTKPK